MVQKFRKKPVVIEAVQLTWQNWNQICDFTGVGSLNEGKPEGCYIHPDTGGVTLDTTGEIGLMIPTKEGLMVARQNDWIIKEAFPTGDRDFYPCKPDIFEKTYEKV